MNTLDTIPPEIRLDIFKQLLPSSNITYVGATRDGLFDVELNENNAKGEAQGIWPSMGNVTHLLGVCRLFDNELSPLIYKNKIFYVRNAPDSLLQTAKILKNVRPENLELIKGVILNYQICTHDAFSRNVNWSTISERDHGEVVEKPKMLMAKKKFCRAAANKLRFLSIRVETRNCQWLTAATFSAKAAWLKDLLKIPGIAIRWLSVESPLIPRDPENETRAAFKKRIEDRLHVKGVRVRVQPPGGNYCKFP